MTEATLGRFTIREFNIWDGPAVFAMTGDPVVMKYMGFEQHHNVAQAEALINTYVKAPGAFRAICDGANMLGMFGFEVQGHQATITLMFRRDVRGAGREFAKPFLQWAFTHPTLWRVWSYVHTMNTPGQRVTERLGAQKEGRLRRFAFFPNVSDEPQDVYVYSLVR